MVFCCSERECKMRSLHCQLNNDCGTHCSELLGSYHKYIQLLLKARANPNLPDDVRWLLMELVALCEGKEKVELLLRPPWPPPVHLDRFLSTLFCCLIRKCKMKLLHGRIRELLVLSNTASVCLLYQKWLMEGPARCISEKLHYDDYKISKHRANSLCIHGKIPWPPPVLAWSSDEHKFNKYACLWRGGLQLMVISQWMKKWSPVIFFFYVRQTTVFCIIQLMDVYLLSCNYYNTQSISETTSLQLQIQRTRRCWTLTSIALYLYMESY